MDSQYAKLSNKLNQFRIIYRKMIKIGTSENDLKYLYDEILGINSEIKKIDKLIGTHYKNCMYGNYNPSIII
jgi:hypothetical protein